MSGIPLFPEQASTLAAEVDNLYLFIVGLTAFFAVAVSIAVVVFAVKYRDPTGEGVGAPVHGSIFLELTWTGIPFILAVGIFVWSTVVYFHIVRPPDQSLEIYSTGKRWMWRFQHLEGRSEINELHVPKGRPIKVTFTSEDVLHDLYIPAFRVKADAIPGRYSAIWFNPTRTGEYHLFCAEYCGTNHSGMIGRVIVMEPDEYEAWLAGEGGPALSVRGQQLFQQLACHSCHLADGSGRGPSLVGIFNTRVNIAGSRDVVATESYLRESILTPQLKMVDGYQPVMPTFQGLVNEEGLMSLIEYIKSLSAAPQGSAAPQAGVAVSTQTARK